MSPPPECRRAGGHLKLCDEDSKVDPRLQGVHAADRIEEALQSLDTGHRTVADGEWGLRVDAVPLTHGWPLDVGLALHAGGTLLRVQAEVCGPGQADPADLLHRNRRTPLVAFTQTLAGVVWIEGWLPVAAADAALLDRMLGLLVAAAADVRESVLRGS